MFKLTSLFSSKPKKKELVYSHYVDHRPEGGIVKDIDADEIYIAPDEHFYPHHGITEEEYASYCQSCIIDDVVVYDELPCVSWNTKDNKGYIDDGRHRVRAAQDAGKKIRVRIVETVYYREA